MITKSREHLFGSSIRVAVERAAQAHREADQFVAPRVLASSHGARIHTSRSSSVLKLTGIPAAVAACRGTAASYKVGEQERLQVDGRGAG